jgi:ABC-2 type transport system permease protein
MRTVTVNPVLRRELLERWRGGRAVIVLVAYLGVLGGLLLLIRWIGVRYFEDQALHGWGPAPIASGPMLGRFLLENLLAMVLGLVLFVAPGYAAAQLAGERERRTLGLLRITLVRPRSIVLGKLGASSAWIVLLVVATAPLAASAFVLGGATPGDLVRGLIVVLVVTVSVAAMAIGVSSRVRRTTAAVVLTYGLVLVLVVGTLIGAFAEFAARGFDLGPDRRPVALYLNPFYGLADASASNAQAAFGMGLPSVLTPFAAALPARDDVFGIGFDAVAVEEVVVDGAAVGGDVGVVEAPAPDVAPLVAQQPLRRGPRVPVWVVTSGLYLLLAGGALTVASRSLGPRDGLRET